MWTKRKESDSNTAKHSGKMAETGKMPLGLASSFITVDANPKVRNEMSIKDAAKRHSNAT